MQQPARQWASHGEGEHAWGTGSKDDARLEGVGWSACSSSYVLLSRVCGRRSDGHADHQTSVRYHIRLDTGPLSKRERAVSKKRVSTMEKHCLMSQGFHQKNVRHHVTAEIEHPNTHYRESCGFLISWSSRI